MRRPAISLRLRHKLALAFMMVLLPVLGVAIYDNSNDYELLERSILDGQLRTAEALGGALEGTLDRAIAELEDASADADLRSLDSGRIAPYLAGYLAAHQEYLDLQVWDSGGHRLGSAAAVPTTSAQQNPPYADVFHQVLSSGRAVVSSIAPSNAAGTTVLAVAVPIRAQGSGSTEGVAMAVLDQGALSGTMQSVRLSPGQNVFLADTTGRVVLQPTDPGLAPQEWSSAVGESIRSALSRGKFEGRVGGPSIGTSLAAVVRTDKYGWVVGISTLESSALGEHTQQLAEEMVIYLAALLLGAVLGATSTRAIIGPLDRLVQTVKGLARGELQLRAEVRTGDELQGACDALNDMAATLQREQRRLRFLSDTGAVLTSSTEPGRVMQLLAEQATEVLGEACWVYLLSGPERLECRLAGVHVGEATQAGPLARLMERYHAWLVENLALPAVRSARPLLIKDVRASDLEEGLRRRVVQLGGTSLLVVPLLARGHPVGILASLSLSEERALGDEELALATDLAARAALVADNAMLFQQVQSERLGLQTVLETVPVGVVVAEAPDARVSMLNPKGQEILGQSDRRPIPEWQTAYGISRPDGTPYEGEDLPLARSLFRGEVVTGEEMVVRQPSGRPVSVLIHSAPLRRDGESVTAAVAAFQDITPLREAQTRIEEYAREAEQRRSELDAVIDAVGEGITIVDDHGCVRRINRKGKEIWELPADWEDHPTVLEQVSRNDLRYPDYRPMPPEDRPLVRAARGEVFSSLEAVLVQADGRRKNILFSSGSVKDADGNIRLAMAVYRDITPIRELEQAREEFISVIAHDLRSPLTAINGFAGILRKLPPEWHGRAQETRAVDTILTSSKRLERMVEDLLDSSRIEARRLTLQLQRVDLSRLLPEICERAAEGVKDHSLRIEARGEIPPLRADPARLEQILTNLLTNAAKYSFPESEIRLEVEPREGEVLVTIVNQGQGIPPEETSTIFSRFRRTREARAGAVPGLGLGLYITKGLVEAHGGRIWVESEPGKMTAFRFTMPIDKTEGRGLSAA